MTYEEFLKTKELKTIKAGFDVPEEWLSEKLFPFQRDIVRWALKKGKAAILTGCGTGKSLRSYSAPCVTSTVNILISSTLRNSSTNARDAR